MSTILHQWLDPERGAQCAAGDAADRKADNDPRPPPTYDSALHVMEAQGGSFVRSLAACYYAADTANKLRLRAAFHDYFADYERRFEALKGQP